MKIKRTQHIDFVDLFAGPGGATMGGVSLGLHDLGIEWDDWACATRRAAGLTTLQGDVSQIDPLDYLGVEGLWASPPCQGFSKAGLRKGLGDSGRILEHIEKVRANGSWIKPEIDDWDDPRSELVLEPLRWMADMLPTWAVWEQVPFVQPIWDACAAVLEEWGYFTWTGKVWAEQYGILSPCANHSPTAVAPNAANDSVLATGQVSARASATTPFDYVGTTLARTAVAHWVRAIGQVDANDVTWLERALAATSVGRGTSTATGEEVAAWTNVATSEFGLTAATAASIASSWKASLDALSLAKKWSTMSTDRQTTTIRAILSSTAATPIIDSTTGRTTYAVDCGLCLDTAVPQKRERAILIASKTHHVSRPRPTHSEFHPRSPEKIDEGTLPPVTMAEALGWGMTQRPYPAVAPGTSGGGTDPLAVGGSGARKIVYGAHASGDWVPQVMEPVDGLPRVADQSGTKVDLLWPAKRPSTVLPGRGMVQHPGATANRYNGSTKSRNDGFRLTVQEGGVLQSFARDYPWQGPKGKMWEQVGNVVPPLVARACIAEALGINLS